jgi:hypothetical protein
MILVGDLTFAFGVRAKQGCECQIRSTSGLVELCVAIEARMPGGVRPNLN